MKSTLISVGRIVYAIVMAIFGLFHFMNGANMAAMVPIPGGIFWIYLTGAALILAAVAIIINKKASLATLLLGIMLAIFALSLWLPGAIGGDQAATSNFLKDLALAAAAFYMSGNSED